MKKKMIMISSALLLIIVALYFLLFDRKAAEIILETTAVKKGNISNVVTATGTIEPLTQVEVGTQVSGVIEKIYVDYNSKVKKGQLIAELDKTALKATVAEAQANLSNAKNELEYQEKNYNRITQLHDSKTVSDTDYEQALYQLNSAKIAVSQRQSELNRAQTNLSYASIYSPIDGVVLSRSVDEGQTVAAAYATPTLFSIAQDLTKMQVEADVDEADIGQVKLDQRVTFTVDAYPDDEFSGTVTQVRIEPIEESNVITYTVIIQAENPDEKLMPGLTASTTIYTKEVNDVLTLEAKALQFEPNPAILMAYARQHQDQVSDLPKPKNQMPDQPVSMRMAASEKDQPPTKPAMDKNAAQVWVKKGDNIEPVTIKTGMTDGINVEVEEGLQLGDGVVYAMYENKPGDKEGAPSSRSPFLPSPPGRR